MSKVKPTASSTQAAQALTGHIREYVSAFYQGLDAWHNLDHGARVATMALEINKTEGADAFLVEAGAWLHQFHPPNLELLKPILNSLTATETQRTDLFQIVSICRPNLIESRPAQMTDQAWKAAQIVFDADALDLMGPSGLLREINCNTMARGRSHSEAVTQAREVQELFLAKLQTDSARDIARTANDPLKSFWFEHDRYEKFLNDRGAPSY